MSNVAITSTGSIGSASAMDFGGYYVGDPDDTEDDIERPTGTDVITAGDMEVLVDSVRLDAGDTVTFVFSAAMVQAAMGDAAFALWLMVVRVPVWALQLSPFLKAVHSQSVSERQQPAPVRQGRPDGHGCCRWCP